MIENENEDVVMTQLSLSSEIIPRYGFHKHIAATSKYCLPFFLKNTLSPEDTLEFQKAESETMLNSVVMLDTNRENDDKIPVVPVSINNITADHPQTIFLTMRMFPKGQQFNILSRLYLDSIADQITLYQQLNINPTAIDKSNIISYLSSMFMLLQNNPNFDQDIEVLFGRRELELFIRQTSLDTSKKWGFIHSRRLARVLFTICLFLSPIMPFDILSQECAKIFEPVKKDKLNELFYFIYKRDIWFALQTVTNGSIAETFSLACACADISPIILLQICSFMAPIREGRYLDRRPPSSFMPGECPNVPEIQASTKTWVNLISLRFNNLLPPKPNNISFDVGINVFYQLGLNNLKEQATDLKSAMQMFFSLKQPPVFKGDFAPPFLDFPFFPLAAPGFALDYENPVYRQFAFLRTLYSNPVFDNSVWTSSQPSRNEDIRSRIENNSTANFNNSNQYLLSSASTSSTSSTSSPLNNVFGNSQFPSERTSYNALNFNNLDYSLFNNIPSTSTSSILNGNSLFSRSLFNGNSVTRRNNDFGSTFTTNTSAKKVSKSHDQKSKMLKSLKRDVSTTRNNNGLNMNSYDFSSPSIAQPSSSSLPLENNILQSTQKNHLNDNNNFHSSQLLQCESSPSSSTSPMGINLLRNAQPSLFNSSNNNFNINDFKMDDIFNAKPSTSSSLPERDDAEIISNLLRIMRSEPSGSVSTPNFAPPKMKEQTFFRPAEAYIFEACADLKNATSSIPISPPEKDNLAGSSKSCANKSSESLSANCNNFKLNHLIHINSKTPNPTVTNEQTGKTIPFIPEISVNQVEIRHISSTKSNLNDMSSTVEKTIKETQLLENENNHMENCRKELESIRPLEKSPQKSISPTSNAESVKSPERQTEDICMDNEYIENINEELKEQNVETIEIGNEMTKKDEVVTEDSEDAQEFELLIETSFEPLTENPTTELVVEDEYCQSDDNDVNEILDPDECPVKCICGFNHLEQQTIFCEKCRVWKHIKCLKAEKYANSDDEYFCPDCNDKNLPISPSDAQDLVAKSLKLEHLDSTLKQCYELKLFGALSLQWKSLLQNSGNSISSKVGKLIYERRMRWAVVKKGQAGRLLAGFGIKAGAPVIGVNGIAAYMMDAKNYCTCYRNLSLTFLPEPIIIEMKGRNGGLAHEILPSCRPNCEIKFSIYKNNLYCYLVAMCEIDDDDELTIAFPDNDDLHVSCAESSSECTDKCPSQIVSRLSKIKKDISRDEPSTKKHKRF